MDPSIPPSNSRCLFFKLPAELRNEIYEYALTADDGLVCRSQDNKHFTYHALRDGGVEDTEFNQIHYVCRQLQTETKGLVLYLNNNNSIFKCDVAMTSVEDDFILLDTSKLTFASLTLFISICPSKPVERALHLRRPSTVNRLTLTRIIARLWPKP
jgi:hypothetical protein